MRTRKGILFTLFLFIVIILALAMTVILITGKKDQASTANIGTRQAEVFQAYTELNARMAYLDMAAKTASCHAIRDTAAFNTKLEDLQYPPNAPAKAFATFTELFNKRIKDILAKHPGNRYLPGENLPRKETAFFAQTWHLSMRENELLGFTAVPVQVLIVHKPTVKAPLILEVPYWTKILAPVLALLPEKIEGASPFDVELARNAAGFVRQPSAFTIQFSDVFAEYERIAEQMVSGFGCRGKESAALREACLNRAIKYLNDKSGPKYSWQPGESESLIVACAEQQPPNYCEEKPKVCIELDIPVTPPTEAAQ
ncbi:hypothetical protein HY642_01770 [Candidatus Woesearchaeota archaeon]|nr:hypothetical protein [Candidatus Woesearchaeota archaeon]